MLGVVVPEVVVKTGHLRRAILATLTHERKARVPEYKEQFQGTYEQDARPDPTAHARRVR